MQQAVINMETHNWQDYQEERTVECLTINGSLISPFPKFRELWEGVSKDWERWRKGKCFAKRRLRVTIWPLHSETLSTSVVPCIRLSPSSFHHEMGKDT